tara:strand:+ start:169 stop:762 length:594 start_codon:yes stop_codon:yes gene_type:complete
MILLKNLFKSFAFLSIVFIYQTLNISIKAEEYDYGDYKYLNYFRYLDENDKKILELVDKTQKVLITPKENTPACKSENIWGYVNAPAKYTDGYFRTDMTICTNRILTSSKNYNDASYYLSVTLHHEAFHTAQLCQFPPSFVPFGINNGNFSKVIRDQVYGSEVYADNNEEQNLIEMEAFYVEQKPKTVLLYLENYCF